MSGLMSIGGISSGLDTDNILSQLEALAKAPVTRLQQQKAKLAAQNDAWNAVNTRLLAIKDKASALALMVLNPAQQATSSESSVSASANGATTGSYSFTVTSVGAYHQQVTGTIADLDTTPVGTGTLKLTVGSSSTSIDLSSVTLTGLRDTINQANIGINASIISTGSSYRLMLSSSTLGSAGAISTTGSDAAAVTAMGLTDLQAATDAVLTFGSGGNAFQVTRSSNTLTDVLPGMTINVTSASVGKTVTLNVTQNTSAVRQGIQEFVGQYNAFLEYVAQQQNYDAEKGTTPVLFGQYELSQIRNELASTLNGSISGLSSTLNSSSQLGLMFDANGKMTIDDTKLDDALKTSLTGVLRLFGAYSVSSHAGVKYLSSTEDTQSVGTAGYAVTITQAATQASLVIDSAGDGLPAALGGDETLTVNGTAITLQTDMTRAQVIAAINAKSSTTGVRASLTGADGTGTGNFLTFTQVGFGSKNIIRVSSNLAADGTNSGIGTATISDSTAGAGNTGVSGLDVIGTINGQAATGLGRVLTSTEGDAKGLRLSIESTITGDLGSTVFSRGIGSMIDILLGKATGTNGTIENKQDTIQAQLTALDDNILRSTESANREIQRQRDRFNAMEVALSKLQQQSAQLNSQIAQLNA